MPRKLRNPKFRNELTSADISFLRWGYDFFGSSLKTDTQLREAWDAGRERVCAMQQKDIPERTTWPLYAELRFDKGMTHDQARAAIDKAAHRA